jgi:hypothetical protein
MLQQPSAETLQFSVPDQLFSLSIIAGQILEEVYASQQIRSSVLEGYLQQLASWTESLPVSLRMELQSESVGPSTGITRETLEGDTVSGVTDQIEDDPGLTEDCKLMIHLTFLSVKILLSRPLLVQSVMGNRHPSNHSGELVAAQAITAKFTALWYGRTCYSQRPWR